MALRSTTAPAVKGRREEIVKLMCHGHCDRTVAAIMGVSVRTVRRDIAELMEMHGVRSRFMLGARLAESGWRIPGVPT